MQCPRTLLAIGFLAAATLPVAAASCRDEIASLDARVKASVAAASAQAASRQESTESGGAGEPAIHARALLNRAHTLAQRGDDDACRATIALAQKQLGQ